MMFLRLITLYAKVCVFSLKLLETRELESEARTLIYENYDKFIQAAETLSINRLNLADTVSKAEALLNKFNQASSDMHDIDVSLKPARVSIRELDSQQLVLSKVVIMY